MTLLACDPEAEKDLSQEEILELAISLSLAARELRDLNDRREAQGLF